MSLSLARPIVTEPAPLAGGAPPRERNFTNRVARLDTSPESALTEVISVGETASCGGAEPAFTTVVSAEGGLAGAGRGAGTCTSVGCSRTGRRWGGTGGRLGGGGCGALGLGCCGPPG